MRIEPEKDPKLMDYFSKIGRAFFYKIENHNTQTCRIHLIDLYDPEDGAHLCDLIPWDSDTEIENGHVIFNPSFTDTDKGKVVIAYVRGADEEGVSADCYHGFYSKTSDKINFRKKELEELDGDLYTVESEDLQQIIQKAYDTDHHQAKELAAQRTIAGFNQHSSTAV